MTSLKRTFSLLLFLLPVLTTAAAKSLSNQELLRPYEEYAAIKSQLNKLSGKQLEDFIAHHAGSAPAEQVRATYLKRLAKASRWNDFLQYYNPHNQNKALHCHHLNALINTGKSAEARMSLEEIWLSGSSLPNSCDPVFAHWHSSGALTADLVWQRIKLAFKHGNTRLAASFKRYLPGKDKTWLQQWVKLYKNPAQSLDGLRGKHRYKGAILGDVLARLADDDIGNNLKNALNKRSVVASQLDSVQLCELDNRFAQAVQRRQDASVYTYLKQTSNCTDQTNLQVARFKAALLREDWSQFLKWFDKASQTLRSDKQWRYWQARALQQTGDNKAAKRTFKELIQDRSFYAFLAADQIGEDYYWNQHSAVKEAGDQLEKLRQKPAMQRIRLLFNLGRNTDARREWYYLTAKLDRDELIAAAALFDAWGLYDRAIFTVSKAKYWDDVELRFPVKYAKLIGTYAQQRKIDPSWATATLRQESAFMTDARSSAGARGLMQLLPETARFVARKFGFDSPSNTELLQPERNISLGTGYLKLMQNHFSNQARASAAYNAGPGRVKQWAYDKHLPMDVWIELIPYKETRNYVKRVMTYAAIYDRRLNRKQIRISKRIGL